MDKKDRVSFMNEAQTNAIISAIKDLTASNHLQAEAHNKEIEAVQSEYTNLTKVVEGLAVAQRESAAQSEKSIKNLTNEMHKMTVAMTKLAVESAGNKKETDTSVAMIREDINQLENKVDKLEGRAYILELESAGNAGAQATSDKQTKFWADNWYKILTTVIMAGSFIAMVYYTAVKNGNGQPNNGAYNRPPMTQQQNGGS